MELIARGCAAIDQVNVVIIGGGIVGCAIAYTLSSRWDDLFVLEALPRVRMLPAFATAA